MVESQIYFITSAGLTKIGISQNVGQRLKSLQSGSAVPLTLVHSFPGTWRDEQYLHERFTDRRRHGEWFEGEFTLEECQIAEVMIRTRGEHVEGWRLVSYLRADSILEFVKQARRFEDVAKLKDIAGGRHITLALECLASWTETGSSIHLDNCDEHLNMLGSLHHDVGVLQPARERLANAVAVARARIPASGVEQW